MKLLQMNERPKMLMRAFVTFIVMFCIASISVAEGFMIRVTADNAAIKDGEKVLATVPKGTRLWCFDLAEGTRAKVKVPKKNDLGWLELSQAEEIQPTLAERGRLAEADAHYKRHLSLSAAKQIEDARRELEASIAIVREIKGSDHPDLADLLLKLGDFDLELAEQNQNIPETKDRLRASARKSYENAMALLTKSTQNRASRVG